MDRYMLMQQRCLQYSSSQNALSQSGYLLPCQPSLLHFLVHENRETHPCSFFLKTKQHDPHNSSITLGARIKGVQHKGQKMKTVDETNESLRKIEIWKEDALTYEALYFKNSHKHPDQCNIIRQLIRFLNSRLAQICPTIAQNRP